MATTHSPNQNHLLAALPTTEFSRLLPHLELVAMPLGEVIFEPGGQLQHAYFPTTAIVSLHYVMESGASSESAGVGNEGVVGVSLFMGGNTTPSSAVVKTAGHAYRQTAVCNRHHSVEQQLCRWLLSTLDRIPSGDLVMTQELVASMLGVRREGVTNAAGTLQDAGFIRYRRGHIAVLDRSGLEGRVCECYAVVKKEMARLQSDVQYRQVAPAIAG